MLFALVWLSSSSFNKLLMFTAIQIECYKEVVFFSFAVIMSCYVCVCTSQQAETQDGESAFGSDSSSVLDWKPSEAILSQTTRKAISAQVRERQMYLME